jgi:hypothetical protein
MPWRSLLLSGHIVHVVDADLVDVAAVERDDLRGEVAGDEGTRRSSISRYKYFVHAPPVEIDDFEAPSISREALAQFRQMFQLFQHQASDSLIFQIAIELEV